MNENEEPIINDIKNYLKRIGDEKKKNIKIIFICNLFDYLSQNINFINSHPKFKKVMIDKCNQLTIDVFKDDIHENVQNHFKLSYNKLINSF